MNATPNLANIYVTAQKLARRAQRRERQIVGTFFQIAETVGMTPAQVATSAVVVYATCGQSRHAFGPTT